MNVLVDRINRAVEKGDLLDKMASLLIISSGYSNPTLSVLERRNKNYCRLWRRYIPFLKENLDVAEGVKVKNPPIWFCWLQGIREAPDIVQACYKSLMRHEADRSINLVTKDSLDSFVSMPAILMDKWRSGRISNTHFSDLLRNQLLIEHGGVWLDSTVYLTGSIPSFMESRPLFLYKHTNQDDIRIRYNSWFISSYKGNGVIKMVQSLLVRYWEENDKILDYFLWHLFLTMVANEISDFDSTIYPVTDDLPEQLGMVLFERYDEQYWNALTSMTSIHKLSNKYDLSDKVISGTLFERLVPQC